MVPVSVAPANQYADTPSGIADPTTKGPDWIQIGTEGGFMPKPVVVPQQIIGYNLDPAFFNFGVVNQHSLFLGAAERADVIVDFSQFDGKTLILYNDSPAPVPAGAAPYDYYTGNANQMDAGGAPTTQPGYGPNTRTVMQIRVTKPLANPTPDVTLANLEKVFAKDQVRSAASSRYPRTRSLFLRRLTTLPTTTRSRRLLHNSMSRSPTRRRLFNLLGTTRSPRLGLFRLQSRCHSR